MLASGSAAALTTSAAACTSIRDRSDPPVMLKRMPLAPSMETSRRELLTAARAASTALFSPVPRPMAIHAGPALLITDLTSAKSRLTSPGMVTSSAMACTPWRSTSSAKRKAFSMVTFSSQTAKSRSLGMMMRVSTCSFNRAIPSSASLRLRLPSKLKGLVTTPMVKAPASLAISATTGAAPVPVPPPIPAATKTRSDSFTAS